jgi:hypothetical protein
MSLPYLIDKDLRIVFCKYEDTPAFDLWAEQMGAVFLDPGFEPGFDFIFDCSIVKTAPTKEFIEKLIKFVDAHPNEFGKGYRAIVATGAAAYGMARMYQGIMGETEHLRVFTDVENAKRWLRNKGLG